MSDESPPQPLRLKPRAKPDSAGAPTDPATPGAPSESPAQAETPSTRLRLKPKLSADTPPAAEPPSPAPPSIPTREAPPPPVIRLKPRSAPETAPLTPAPPRPSTPSPPPESNLIPPPPPTVIPAEPGAAGESPKFKLKVKPATGPDAAAAAPLESAAVTPPPPPLVSSVSPPLIAPAAAPKPGSPPPFPLVTHSAAPPPPPPPRKFPPPPAAVPHVRAPVGVAADAALPGARPARRKISRPALLGGVLGLAALAAGAIYFFVLREKPPPPPPIAISKPAPTKRPPAKADTPSDTLNQIATIPGKAIAKAQDVIAARRASEQGRVDAIVEGEDPPDARALATPPPSKLASGKTPAPVTATSQIAPGVTATTSTSSTAAAADASPAFRSWVANIRINGVFQGDPARALINGRTFRAGQTIDAELGIVFVGLTDDAKSIVFRDASGATVTRRF